MEPLAIIGAGGHAKAVIDMVECAGRHRIVAVFDDDPATWGRMFAGTPSSVASTRSWRTTDSAPRARASRAMCTSAICRSSGLAHWSSRDERSARTFGSAGVVVIDDVPDEVTVVGVPTRVIRERRAGATYRVAEHPEPHLTR